MRFKISLTAFTNTIVPINYQYLLGAAIYRIIAKGDSDYAAFLHESGYGKGFKLFTFSQLNVPFKIEGERLELHIAKRINVFIQQKCPKAYISRHSRKVRLTKIKIDLIISILKN